MKSMFEKLLETIFHTPRLDEESRAIVEQFDNPPVPEEPQDSAYEQFKRALERSWQNLLHAKQLEQEYHKQHLANLQAQSIRERARRRRTMEQAPTVVLPALPPPLRNVGAQRLEPHTDQHSVTQVSPTTEPHRFPRLVPMEEERHDSH